LFESLDAPSAARSIRGACAPPLIAIVISQLYFLLYPLLPAVPAVLVYGVGAALLAGGGGGFAIVVRQLVRFRAGLDAAAWLWAVAAAIFSLACLWFASAIFLPWL
jgi:hypothetical protein